MSRVFKSMTYRLIHSKLVWLIIIALILLEVFTLFFGGSNGKYSECFTNHTEYSHHDHESERDVTEFAKFEEEDPLIVSKFTQNVYMGHFNFLQGQMTEYEVSIANCGSVSELLAMVLLIIFAADAVFVMVFYGEMFSDGAIRNMVTVKTNKVSVYLVSVILNALMCLFMYILVFAVLAACTLIAGFYPIIYAPAFIAAVLTGLLVTVMLTSLFILILFVDQVPVVSFVFCGAIVALGIISLIGNDAVFARPYNYDNEQIKSFAEGGYKVAGEGEWYFPVDDFRVGRVYYPEDNETVDFLSDKPNPYYPGDAMAAVSRALYRANVMNFPFEINMFFIYPMYRDGLFARYAVFSAAYLVLILAGGCCIVSKRNFD
ncbi:MAG: DUF1705 domain-containing protein [Saccharofermentans sp.]|nr:DUF1705 domain-containing protein [Saccharofermentans sp.]